MVLAVSGLSVISITANAATIFISGNYEYTVNSDDTVNIAGYKGLRQKRKTAPVTEAVNYDGAWPAIHELTLPTAFIKIWNIT